MSCIVTPKLPAPHAPCMRALAPSYDKAKGVNHLETPLRQLQVTHSASTCPLRRRCPPCTGGMPCSSLYCTM